MRLNTRETIGSWIGLLILRHWEKRRISLMFAKISDGTKAAYTSEHNIYMEDLATGKVTALTTDGTAH